LDKLDVNSAKAKQKITGIARGHVFVGIASGQKIKWTSYLFTVSSNCL